MTLFNLEDALRFYFITDYAAPQFSALEQVRAALAGGATFIQYRNKAFVPEAFDEVVQICRLCKSNGVPFVVNDDIVLAKAVGANGVHVGQDDDAPRVARNIMGPDAVIGVSVSTPDELAGTDLSPCDYIGTGPVFFTGTKPDAKTVIGLTGLKTMCGKSPAPVVAIGGIDAANAGDCLAVGAAGIAVISTVSRADNPHARALELAAICGCPSAGSIRSPWSDEFGLIEKLVAPILKKQAGSAVLPVAAGDDAAVMNSLRKPVITTDTQREGVHFSLAWQAEEEIGQKAVAVTLSDLAAAYADPVCLFVNLGLPPYISEEQAVRLYTGIEKGLAAYGCLLGGGNVSRAGELTLDLFAIGEGFADIVPLRKNARSGDVLCATGPLGLARAGLERLMNRQVRESSLVKKFKFPKARFDAARILAAHNVSCVMDISDGLSGDAAHVAKASRISIRLEMDAAVLHPDLVDGCNGDVDAAMGFALAGGEDYELLFACPPAVFAQVQNDLSNAIKVGQCLPFQGAAVLNPPQSGASFQHGKPET